MAHPNEETLDFPALMITTNESFKFNYVTSINVTHSNINTSDISSKFHKLPSTKYRTFCYHKSIASVNVL